MRGFGIQETLVALSIAALVAALGSSAWHGWLRQQQLATFSALLLADLQHARTLALSSDTEIQVCALDARTFPGSGDWTLGWRLERLLGGEPTVLSQQLAPAGRVRVLSTQSLLNGFVFNSRGFARLAGGSFAAGSWTLCAGLPQSRVITLSGSGRLRISDGSPC